MTQQWAVRRYTDIPERFNKQNPMKHFHSGVTFEHLRDFHAALAICKYYALERRKLYDEGKTKPGKQIVPITDAPGWVYGYKVRRSRQHRYVVYVVEPYEDFD